MKKRISAFALVFTMLCGLLPLSASAAGYSSSVYYERLKAVRLTDYARANLVNVALSQVGYREGDNGRELDGSSKGKGNYTEYGRWYGLQDSWCAMFISWCADKAGLSKRVLKTAAVASCEAFGCTWKGRDAERSEKINYTPLPGDLIIYDWAYDGYTKKSPAKRYGDHIGIVVKVKGDYVYTVEGNRDECVRKVKLRLDDDEIKGYAVPNYPEHKHSYTYTKIRPDCENEGYTLGVCICGDSCKKDFTEPLGHSTEIRGSIPAGCTENGYSGDGVCTRCMATVSYGAVINALGHESGEDCARCAESDGHRHEYKSTVTAASCENAGYTSFSCDCGDEYRAERTEALGHSYDGEKYCRLCGKENPDFEIFVPNMNAANIASGGKIKLSWEKAEGAASYEVYRSEKRDGVYTRMFTTSNTSYTNTSATAGTNYYYKLRALDVDGKPTDYGEYSKTVCRTCDLPAPRLSTSNDAKTGRIKLSWQKVEGASQYELYRSGYKNGEYKKLATLTDTDYLDTISYSGYIYYYKLRAICSKNTDANSAYSDIVSECSDLPAPRLSAANDAESGKNRLSWNKISGASEYELYRSGYKNGEYKLIATVADESFTDGSARAGSSYYYRLKAVSERRESANSAFSNTVERCCDCAAPSISLELSGSYPRLSWAAVADADSYTVYRASSKDGKYTEMFRTSGLSYTNMTAKAGGSYYYKIVAGSCKSVYANSAYSNVVSVKLAR